jgi:hypothetical protein
MLQSKVINRKQAERILGAVYASKAIKQYYKLMEDTALKSISKLKSLSHNTKELHLIVEAMLPTALERTRAED